jgi:hypothetical protein
VRSALADLRGARALALALALSLPHLALVPSARADGGASLAESLFEQGLAAMNGGDLERACRLFAESQRADPGGGTLLNLALCHERAGRLATAWAHYKEALSAARRDARVDRIAFAEEHIEALEPRLPRLAVGIEDPAPDMRGTLDGVALPSVAWGVVSPVDPGEHELRIEAPRRRAYVLRVSLAEGETKRVTVPPLVQDFPETPESPRPGGTRRIVGWSLVGTGGAAVALSGVLGVLAIGAESTADAACPGAGACADPRGLDASARASTFAGARGRGGRAGGATGGPGARTRPPSSVRTGARRPAGRR